MDGVSLEARGVRTRATLVETGVGVRNKIGHKVRRVIQVIDQQTQKPGEVCNDDPEQIVHHS